MAVEALVEVRGLTHRYRRRFALRDVSLTIPAGSTTAVVGPDGVGKSALLSLIAGARRMQTGEVRVFGADMRRERQRATAFERIAFMPQGLGKNLYPTLSVRENIDFHGRLYSQSLDERRARILRLTEATGLSRFLDRPAGELSGGMRQKLSLCCALVHDPDLLILDEPTTGIDPLSRRQFWALIDQLRAERPAMTVLVATGYMEEAERFQRIIALDDGKILADGPAAEVIGDADGMEAAYTLLVSDKPAEPIIAPPLNDGDGEPAIRARGLTRRFGDFVAVDDVSFEIRRGEIFGFLGSNGCGKTTTMKMLVGLLAASSGEVEVLGEPVDASSIARRARLGYMSQAFSLYEELTVRGNLALQAKLYGIPSGERARRLDDALRAFDLLDEADSYPAGLPLGVRQRLQLAAACLHRPDILILDEPTSGVDPAARDMFWRTIIRLAREDGVTIFLSTHFMNEAARCDRISLMNAGKVLAVGAPEALRAQRRAATLEEAFVDYLAEAQGGDDPTASPVAATTGRLARSRPLARVWAFASRESLELRRDPVRLGFGILAPLLLLFVFAYGISFDVENLTFAVLDQDQSVESRGLAQAFEGSRYFQRKPPFASVDDMTRRLRAGEVTVAVDIPPGYGKALLSGRQPELGLTVDGAAPFRGETAEGYALSLMQAYADDRIRQQYGVSPAQAAPMSVEPRFRYNQGFRSVFAITPGVIMFALALIPAMTTALGVVRERELGSILNLYSSPATVGEYLIGKQAPYVVVAMVAFLALIACSVGWFGAPINGSRVALLAGGMAYVFASTAFGVLLSSMLRSQTAVMAAAAILTLIPAVNFSGFLYPASEIEGAGRVIHAIFPGAWFQQVSLGAFVKARSLSDLAPAITVLAILGLVQMAAARILLKKQEP